MGFLFQRQSIMNIKIIDQCAVINTQKNSCKLITHFVDLFRSKNMKGQFYLTNIFILMPSQS